MATEPEFWVWATRPEAQNKAWCKRLNAAGFATLEAPLLAITPVTGDAAQNIKNKILRLDEFNILIFVSQNAVQLGVSWVEQYWPQWPVQQTSIAVGVKTAALLRESVADALCPQGTMDSDAVLAMPCLQQVNGLKVLVFRGLGGLPRLGEALTARGAQVEYCELYQRTGVQLGDAQAKLVRERFVDTRSIVSIFSGETLQNLHLTLAQLGVAPAQVTVLVPGERVAGLALELGFKRTVHAYNASEEVMLQALLDWRSSELTN